MATTSLDQLREFHRFVADKLNRQDAPLSPEEALDLWRQQHPDERSAAEDVAAIQEALDDLANGDRGMAFEEFDREFRQLHQLPPVS